jgi:hypothetical protein
MARARVWQATIVAVAIGALAGAAPSAAAQAGGREEAVEAFDEGTRLADEGRWADALPLFRRAYELTGVPTALFNVGFALRALGRYVESRAAFDELLTLRLDDADREEASSLRAEVAGRIATVELEGLEAPEGTYEVRLDGIVMEDDGARPLEVESDPGTHRVEVRRAGREPFDWSGTLGEGQVRTLTVSLPELPGAGGPGIVAEPWLWIVVGVVVLGGAITIGVVADSESQLDPTAGRIEVRL